MRICVRRESEPRHHEPRRRFGLRLIGIAVGDVGGGNPMIGEQEVRTLADLGPMLLDPRLQGFDISLVTVIVVDETRLRQPPPTVQCARGSIEHRARRRRAVLRIERQDEQLFHVLLGQGLNGTRDAWIAVSHGDGDPHPIAEAFMQYGSYFLSETLGIHCQGRTAAHPDLAIFAQRFERTKRQHHPVQERQPNQAGCLDHPAIAEEFAQVALHREVGRGIRRA